MRTFRTQLVAWATSISVAAASLTPAVALAQAPAGAKPAVAKGKVKATKRKGLKDSLSGDARAAFDRAVTLFEAKNFEGALVEFDRAYQESKDARLLFNMAIAERELKRYSRAVAKLNQELKEGADTLSDDEKKTAEEVLAGLKEFTAPLTVVVNEPDATISIDGTDAGKSPLAGPLTTDVGERTVTAKKAGFLDATQKVNVSGGVAAKVDLKLEPSVKNGKLSVKALGAPTSVVVVDGVEVGPSPWQGDVTAGKHTIEVRSKGFITESRTLDIEYNKTSAIELSLRVDEGKASIKTDKDSTEIFIDGTLVAKGSWSGALSSGGHGLELRRKGAKTLQTELTIATGQTVTREYKLESTGGTPWWVWAGAGAVLVGGAAATYVLTRPKTEDAQPGTISPGTVSVGWKLLAKSESHGVGRGGVDMAIRAKRVVSMTLGVLALASPALLGCAKKKPSAIVVSLSSEAPVPEELDYMEVLVQRGDDTRLLGQYPLSAAGDARLPGTLTLQMDDSQEAGVPITITVTASAGQKARVLRKATLGFSEEKTKLLKMPLRYSCFDFKELCSATQECLGGVCQDTKIDVESLPDYDDKLVFGTLAQGTCFDDTDAGCFANSTTLEASSASLKEAEDGSCTLALGEKARGGKGLNVGLRWAASGALGRFATLEREDGRLVEGFSADDAGNLRLPRGLCAAIKDGRVTAVRSSTACATKSPSQPLCVFQQSVCKADKKPATLATSACFQCMYAPASPKNCAASLDAARCDDASREYLSCLLDTPFDGYESASSCPEPRRAACSAKLGECADDLNSAACRQKYAKLLAYVACTDEVNGGLADDSAADLAAAVARCQAPCAAEGYPAGCGGSVTMGYVAPLPAGTYADSKGNSIVVGPSDVQLRFGGKETITLVTHTAGAPLDGTLWYPAEVTGPGNEPEANLGGWPSYYYPPLGEKVKLWVSTLAGDIRVDLTTFDAGTPGEGFNLGGPFALGSVGAPTVCTSASQQKSAFCEGSTLVLCDPQTKKELSKADCGGKGCTKNAADQNDACGSGPDSPVCMSSTKEKTEVCDGQDLVTCNPNTQAEISRMTCPKSCIPQPDSSDVCGGL